MCNFAARNIFLMCNTIRSLKRRYLSTCKKTFLLTLWTCQQNFRFFIPKSFYFSSTKHKKNELKRMNQVECNKKSEEKSLFFLSMLLFNPQLHRQHNKKEIFKMGCKIMRSKK